MNCPSCQQPLPDPMASACPTCACRISPRATKPVLLTQPPARRPKLQVGVHLAVTVDRTGSSGAFATGIPRTFELICSHLTAKARNLTVFLQSHGDEDEGQHPILHTNGGTVEAAAADLALVQYAGGGDAPEHHLDGIQNLLHTVPWPADPLRERGAILAFTTADSKPARSGAAAGAIGREIKARGILLYLVCEPTPTLQELATAAGGLVFPITNSPDPHELQLIAAQVAASIHQTVASGGTVPLPAVR